MGRPSLHTTVAQSLRQQIDAGLYKQGDRLPGEEQLARQMNVSRVTLREALMLLERDGIITRRHGAGSFVERTSGRISAELNRLEPFASGIARAGHAATEEILSLEPVHMASEYATSLALWPPARGLRLEMLRRVDGMPVVYSRDLIAPDVVDPAEFRRLGRNILDYLAETGRPPVQHSLLTVKAVLPDGREQAVLACDAREPLVELEGVAYNTESRPLYATRFLIRTQHYELTLLRQ